MNPALLSELKLKIRDLIPDIVRFRHLIHSEPELGLMEFKTREKVLSRLKNTAIRFREPLLGTDLIGELPGNSNRTLVLRADMDALPLEEAGNPPYASKNKGMMHACGHDGHTAILMGTALLLDSLKEHLPVNVRFVFQPGEERICAGRDLVAKGCVEGAEAAFALHGWPGLPVGTVYTRPGILYAAGSSFKVGIVGKGCHGAKPENGINPIPIAAQAIRSLYEMHQAENRKDRSVVSVCVVHAGTISNIIPGEARVEGTVRFLSGDRSGELEKGVRQCFDDAIRGTGATLDWDYTRRYDLPVVNTEKGYGLIKRAAESVLPDGLFRVAEKPSMGNEDFAFYIRGREGGMFYLGLGEDRAPLHNNGFDFNDEAIPAGLLMMTALALDYD